MYPFPATPLNAPLSMAKDVAPIPLTACSILKSTSCLTIKLAINYRQRLKLFFDGTISIYTNNKTNGVKAVVVHKNLLAESALVLVFI